MPSIFDELFFNDSFNENFGVRPSMNVVENDKEYRVEITAPGFCKQDASISVDNDRLLVSLEHKAESEPSEKYIRREFVQRNYSQSFILPEDVDQKKISAAMENGILSVILPKQEAKPAEAARQITVC